jgi:hypothetical protein
MALRLTLSMRWCGRLCVAALLLLPAAPACRAAEAAAPTTGETVEELRLETSDGIRIAAWYYPAPEDAKAVATVILVHDLEGSHQTVDNLARDLQRAGCAVVAPDLRCHGGSGSRPAAQTGSGGKGDAMERRLLKKIDLESMAAATGGRLREQSAMRGEIEAVRYWIKQKSDAGFFQFVDRAASVVITRQVFRGPQIFANGNPGFLSRDLRHGHFCRRFEVTTFVEDVISRQ